MANLRILTDNLKMEYAKGMPDGIDERYIKVAIPLLFQRIDELQNALKPFAKVSLIEKNTNIELVSVYHRDVDIALSVLDYDQSVQPKKEVYYPAE